MHANIINDHISYFDNNLLSTPGIGCTYVVRGDELAIVETGTSLCAPTVLAGLRHLGIEPAEVRHIVLTHVHMDHAGGAGSLIAHMPEAQVYLHSLTIPHLVDPTKLLASAARALGELFLLHGTMEPVPLERIIPADDVRLDLGRDVVLEAIHTPGHSPDHLAYLDVASGALFIGDAVGVDVPAYHYLGPVTPPPAIDVPAQHATFDKLLQLPLTQLLFSHYGPSPAPPREVIERLSVRFRVFDQLVQDGMLAGQVDETAIIQTMLGREAMLPDGEFVLTNWVRMSIKGMMRWHTKQGLGVRG